MAGFCNANDEPACSEYPPSRDFPASDCSGKLKTARAELLSHFLSLYKVPEA